MSSSLTQKRSYSDRQMQSTIKVEYDQQPPAKKVKYSNLKHSRAKPILSPPNISLSTSHSTTQSTSHSSNTTHSHSHSHTPNNAKRTDFFSQSLDETYRFTKPTSTIPPPTLGNPALEKVWKEKTEKALLSFQRRKKSNSELLAHSQPNNPIMQLLLHQTTLITDTNIIIALQNCILTLIYSSQSQQKQLNRSRSRYNRNRNQNNSANNNHYRYDQSWYDRLPGPQPHSITRQNLDRLRSYYYWVAEKSDGIRFQLLLSNTPTFEAYFVDRKFGFYKISHAFYAKYLNNVNGPSLLDGELIINEGKLEYLIFDCVAMHGTSLSNNCTSQRVDAFNNFVGKFGVSIGEYAKENDKSVPIIIRAKKHYKAENIGELLQCITYENGEYWFANAHRKTKNDGLVFTPQENNYLMSYDPGALVKWKFLEKNTIDLKVKTPYIWRNRLDLYAGGKGQSDVLFTQVSMGSGNERMRAKFEGLLGEMQRLSDNRNGFVSSFIIECAWNFKRKEWDLLQNRPDKHIPNFITVCTDTLRVMMDNVSKSELMDACKVREEYQQSSNVPNTNNYSPY